jgi:pyridinium-3,5-biscarboxylic acid mononucleotide synthase
VTTSSPEEIALGEPDRPPWARLDPSRVDRTGIPEAVYAPGKTAAQVVAAVRALVDSGVEPVIATRCSPEQVTAAVEEVAGAVVEGTTLVWQRRARTANNVAVVTAGTADQAVAEEAAATLRAFGIGVERIDDVGVAGVHRLLARSDDLRRADALVVVAGMEGALPTAVAGLVDRPLVAVPTSAGYGSSLEGMTALAAMTASCAPGVSVVGIDNGFGAACVVVRWLGSRAASPRAARRDGLGDA